MAAFAETLHGRGNALPLIFASSDRDEAAFKKYFKSMGPRFHALPFDEQRRVGLLKKRFEAAGIPWLVVVDTTTGRVVANEVNVLEREGGSNHVGVGAYHGK